MTQLVRYDEARRALQVASSVDEAKDIRDKAAALEAYARQRNDVELERWVAEIKLRAVVRIGELSRELEASKGGANPRATLPNGGKSKAEALRAAGISTSAAHRAEQLAEHADEVERYIANKAEQRAPVKYTEAIAAVMKATKQAAPRASTARTVHREISHEGAHVSRRMALARRDRRSDRGRSADLGALNSACRYERLKRSAPRCGCSRNEALTKPALTGVQVMAKRRIPAPKRRIDLEPIIEQLGEALCVVECVIVSLETCEVSGPELPALQCALRGLNSVHSRLSNV